MPKVTLDAMTPERLAISPGIEGFVVFFVLAIAIVLLVLNMSKHLRRVDRHRIEQEMRAEFEAEQEQKRAAAEAGGSAASPGSRPHPDDVANPDDMGDRD